MKLRLVLTGEVGAGKSTALAFFARLGWPVCSADALTRELWNEPALQREASRLWGDDLFSGGLLNRPLLAERAFANEEERTKLNRLVHPSVRQATERWLADRPQAVVEIPLAFEAGLPSWCQGVVLLAADRNARRVRNADRMSGPDMERREAGFWPLERRRAQSDWFYENNGTVDELEAFVRSVSDQCRRWCGYEVLRVDGQVRLVSREAVETLKAQGASEVEAPTAAQLRQAEERMVCKCSDFSF